MYHPSAAYWVNDKGRLCCDVVNCRYIKALNRRQWARAKYYSDKQQARIIRSDSKGEEK